MSANVSMDHIVDHIQKVYRNISLVPRTFRCGRAIIRDNPWWASLGKFSGEGETQEFAMP